MIYVLIGDLFRNHMFRRTRVSAAENPPCAAIAHTAAPYPQTRHALREAADAASLPAGHAGRTTTMCSRFHGHTRQNAANQRPNLGFLWRMSLYFLCVFCDLQQDSPLLPAHVDIMNLARRRVCQAIFGVFRGTFIRLPERLAQQIKGLRASAASASARSAVRICSSA